MSSLLQVGFPGGVELLIVAVVAAVLLIVPLVVSGLIYRDAARRDSSHALAWASASFGCAVLGGFLGGVVFWLFYVVVRDEIGSGDSRAAGG